ncbi:MAG: uncharacterized protein A8A55_1473 [Amphiamblys sp. WSBS2006]|nr:MAG: uncharacterized protein A8A55_1473 [Amphiamblys sp. WSBS2006]
MESGTTALKHKSLFFVFTDKNLFLVPEREYNSFQKDKEGCTCLKRKHLSEVTDRDAERVICIVCHGEAAPEDFVSPLCRQMHFVLCRECIDYLKKRTDRREVVCPYCKERESDKAYQEEILDAVLSLMPHQTLKRLELRPNIEVKTATKLTRETKVVLSNVAVSDSLFFRLMARTTVKIKKRISLFGRDSSLGWCIGEFGWRANEPINICFDGHTDKEMKQIHENIKTISRKSIQINAGEIHAKEDGVYFLLKVWTSAGEYSPDLFLESSKREHIKEFLKEENSRIWIGKVKRLDLRGYAQALVERRKRNREAFFGFR